MTYFPVSNSNLSAPHLALFLREKYSLSSFAECRLLKAGINDTYLVKDQDHKFVFRVYSLNWRTQTEIQEELKLLNLLKEKNIYVSYPIADKAENFIQTLNAPEGERSGVLFSYAPGEKTLIFSEDVQYRIGVLMGRLHETTQNLVLKRVNYSADHLLINSLERLSEFLPADTAEMIFMKSTQHYLLREFSKINIEELRKGIVHLDIWFDNLNVTKENEVTLFDFDFCGNGWLCLDPAYYLLQLTAIEKDEEILKSKKTRFLKGYQSVSRLSEEELRALPVLGVSLYFFYLGIQCQRFDNWSNSFLNEDYLKRFINGLVRRFCNIHKLNSED